MYFLKNNSCTLDNKLEILENLCEFVCEELKCWNLNSFPVILPQYGDKRRFRPKWFASTMFCWGRELKCALKGNSLIVINAMREISLYAGGSEIDSLREIFYCVTEK